MSSEELACSTGAFCSWRPNARSYEATILDGQRVEGWELHVVHLSTGDHFLWSIFD